MSFADLAARAIDAVFTTLGESATYYPTIGGPRAITVVRVQGEELVAGLGATQHRHDGALFEARASELADEPRLGARLETSGARWRIRSVRPPDPDARLWLLDCVPDAS